MGLKNNIKPTPTKATFIVTKDILHLYRKNGKSVSKNYKNSNDGQSFLDTLEKFTDLDPKTIRKIEEELKLTYQSEKEEEGNVCMANSPEIRDEYKNNFNSVDLLDYIYAVLHSLRFCKEYTKSLETNFFKIPYPRDQTRFWKLVNLGSQLRHFHQSEMPDIERYKTQENKILKEIAEIELE